MEETRSSLADKLETLENEFRETVEGATEAVSNTVEAVQETVETVKETFDPRKQVERHPWLMMAGAVATGYVAGCLLERSPPARSAATQQPPPPMPFVGAGAAPPAAPPTAPASPGPFASSLEKLKGLAIGSLMSVVRELVTRAAPPTIVSELVSVVDDVTTKLGGKPLRSPPESTAPESRRDEEPSDKDGASAPPSSDAAEAPPDRARPNGRSGKRRPART